MIKRAGILFAAVLAVCLSFGAPVSAEAYSVSSGEAVVEVTSGRLLFAENGDTELPPASTTKILTALIIVEDCDLDTVIEVPKEAAGTEGSSVYLEAGEKLTVRDLLYGLMLRSGNDCAVTLALHHSGSISAFAEHMNERAAELGAKHSHFANPHGLPAEGHYTTAHDLALIAAAAVRNETFSEIVGTEKYTAPDGGCGYARVWQNKNKMLYSYEGADGVKTGYTKEAGRCLVTSATRGGMRLVSAVLNSPSMYERSGELLDACFAKYSMEQVFRADEAEYAVPTDVPEKICRGKCEEDLFYPLAAGEDAQLETQVNLPQKVYLPVHTGEILGSVEIRLQNQLIFSQKIVSIVDMKKSYFDILREIARSHN